MPRAFWVIFFVVFIDLFGFGIVIPILPFFAQKHGASGFDIGLLMMTYSLLQFLVAPVWGKLSDRYGRRPILLISILGASVGMLTLGLAETLVGLFVGRAIGGVAGANISTAYAYVTDITDEKNRSKGMGLLGAAFGLGFTLGPALGGILSQWGYSTPIFFGAGLALLNFLMAFRILGESHSKRGETAPKRGLGPMLAVLKLPKTGTAILLFFLFTFAITQLEVTFAIFMGARFEFDAKNTGLLTALIGVVMVMTQGGLIGRLVPKFGEVRLTRFAFLLGGAALIGFGMSRSLGVSVALLCGLAFARGILQPTLSALASLGAPSSDRGLVMGVFHSGSSLARAIGPPGAGLLFDQVGIGSPFVTAGIIVLLCWAASLIGFRSFQKQTANSQPSHVS